ncbi:MAG: hypothetical protein DELT_02234 [Desulfovibrio sp.]
MVGNTLKCTSMDIRKGQNPLFLMDFGLFLVLLELLNGGGGVHVIYLITRNIC